ncbi:MAG TPA: hypothetical protein VMT46_02095 [Anaerolineaceae bacterium]|nr:hypothetical protein [Anaerolineaceae bacterium]
MSGYKHALVTVQPREIERMHFAEQYLRAPLENPTELAENVRQQNMVQVWNGINEVERRQQDYQKSLTKVGKMVRGWERHLNHRLIEQEEQLASAMQACAGRLGDHLNEVLAERDQRYNDLFAEEQAIRHSQLISLAGWLNGLNQVVEDQSGALMDITNQVAMVNDEVVTIQENLNVLAQYQASREQALANLAAEWVNAAYTIASFIAENYAHSFFFPGLLEQYFQEADLADSNLSQGAYEAGLSLGQQACLHVSELRLELEELESEWRIWRMAALEGALNLQEAIFTNAVIPAMDMDGKILPVEINVNQWSDGRYNLLRDQVDALVEELSSQAISLNTADLRELVEGQIPQLHTRFQQNLLEARVAVLSSQSRINIADMVVEALEEQGYNLQECGYVEGDMRVGYSARIQSLDGSEVVIRVDPSGKSPTGSELTIQSLDVDQLSEHELRHRAKEIARSLEQRGLKVGEFIEGREWRTENREQPVGQPGSRKQIGETRDVFQFLGGERAQGQ